MSQSTVPQKSSRSLVPTTVRLEPRVRKQLTAIAKAHGMTLGAYLRWLAEEQVCYAQAA